jgi:uncharacterized protein YnzC (UPF0291/DUF896 family)
MVPQIVKDDFYKTFQSPDNYKKLIIKDNEITDKLRYIFKNNVWNLEEKAQELKKVNRAESKNNYNSWLNEVYLLDYKLKPKLKPINRKTFFNLGYKGETTNRNELNYISHYKTWVNQFFKDQEDIDNINWFCQNQNEVLLTLMTQRNARNNSLETFRKDLNLLLHFCKIAEAGDEIINKFKVLNMALSLIHNLKEGNNILDVNEEKKFINYDDLLKLQKKLYRDWEFKYEDQAIKNIKDPKIRYINIKALLLAYYSLFPPLRLEALGLKIVNSEEEALKEDNAILIKNTANIWVYLNTIKKQHKAIKFNLSDDIIRSFSGNNVDNLILMIIESVNLYPREFMFINTDGNLYSEKGLQKMLYDLQPDKNLGVNALRSIYASYYMPKINTNQAKRVAFLMRSSVSVLTGSYVKKTIDNQTVITAQPEPRAEVEQEIKETKKQPRDRREYLKNYYEQNKQKIIDSIKTTDKIGYPKRFIRELNDGVISWDKVRASTRLKYKLKFENNKYVSEL